ncbi:oligosaccharide flippase family protein [Exiguobacterium aurantiacum]|uniref:oligosaccharide flippase family protein n=1 Tax=Exiguobacterium aurantiacum TaxID=33987 RepID=UPI00384DE3B2
MGIKKKSKKSNLMQNTLMLYILVFSTYFLNFITIPYQTRILGPEYFGKVGFALAFMMYFQLIVDFGFILSATETVSKHRQDKLIISKVLTSVTIIKGILSVGAFVILMIIINTVPFFKAEKILYILTYFSVVSASFLPDFLYRGMEQMKIITVRTVVVRTFFVMMIFIFLKEKDDYYLIPLLTLVGNTVALFVIYYHVIKYLEIKFIRVNKEFIWKTLKKSSFFFYSRIASTAYTATNTFFIGVFYTPNSAIVGLFTSSDKLITTAKSIFSPIADSLYPYMVRNKDFKLLKKILLLIMPPVIIGTTFVGIYAEEFCALILGEDFREAGKILRYLMPIVTMSPLVYILGFPTLSPMGLAKHANLSVIFAAVIHIVGLISFLWLDIISIRNICYLTVFTQLYILLHRLQVVITNKNILKSKKIGEVISEK